MSISPTPVLNSTALSSSSTYMSSVFASGVLSHFETMNSPGTFRQKRSIVIGRAGQVTILLHDPARDWNCAQRAR